MIGLIGQVFEQEACGQEAIDLAFDWMRSGGLRAVKIEAIGAEMPVIYANVELLSVSRREGEVFEMPFISSLRPKMQRMKAPDKIILTMRIVQ